MIEEILQALGAKPTGRTGRWVACCPVHGDRRPSLWLYLGRNGQLIARCKANKGCTWEAICRAIGSKPSDWFNCDREDFRRGRGMQGKIVATYDYRNAGGDLVYQVVRFEPKRFLQRRPDPNKADAWIWNLEGIAPLPYRLPELLAADARQPVLIVEGEKDADTLRGLGFTSTTNSGGAGHWQGIGCHLTGRRVVIIPDRDAPGLNHALQVAADVIYFGPASLRIVRHPQWWPPGVKDVTEWFEKHHATADAMFKRQRIGHLVKEGSTEYVPKAA